MTVSRVKPPRDCQFFFRAWLRIASYLDVDSGHWLWVGHKTDKGYGKITFKIDKTMYAFKVHRLIWQIYNGAIDSGVELHHSLDCPKNCCNPDHLFPLKKSEHALQHSKRPNYELLLSEHYPEIYLELKERLEDALESRDKLPV